MGSFFYTVDCISWVTKVYEYVVYVVIPGVWGTRVLVHSYTRTRSAIRMLQYCDYCIVYCITVAFKSCSATVRYTKVLQFRDKIYGLAYFLNLNLKLYTLLYLVPGYGTGLFLIFL